MERNNYSQTNSNNYHKSEDIKNVQKMRQVLQELPKFCGKYFKSIEDYTSARTRLAYAYDLRLFFEFLHENNSQLNKMDINAFPIEILDKITREDIEEYMQYLSYYIKDGKEVVNNENGKERKLASLRSFYNYYFEAELIEKNPAALVSMPKKHEKAIIRLENDEVANLLDLVENGSNLTQSEAKYHSKTEKRDLALVTLLLGTGIRVSECVGLNIKDINFQVNGIRIIRKGGYEAIIYFGEEVEEALKDYLTVRNTIIPETGHEEALFLSLQKKRITVRAVQNLVKKYASKVTTLKKITPHKLRSTYGTSLYKETGDIYLVADVLGHKDVNTTRKHYAAQADERRRMAAKAVHLRKD